MVHNWTYHACNLNIETTKKSKHASHHSTKNLITQKPSRNKKVKLEWGWYPQNNCVIDFNHLWWSTLWKACPIKGYNTLLNMTLLEDFTKLLGMVLVRGLWNIHLECHPVKGFTIWLLNQPKSIGFILTVTIARK